MKPHNVLCSPRWGHDDTPPSLVRELPLLFLNLEEGSHAEEDSSRPLPGRLTASLLSTPTVQTPRSSHSHALVKLTSRPTSPAAAHVSPHPYHRQRPPVTRTSRSLGTGLTVKACEEQPARGCISLQITHAEHRAKRELVKAMFGEAQTYTGKCWRTPKLSRQNA